MSSEAPSDTGHQIRAMQFAGAPKSGTAGTYAGIAQVGAFLWDSVHGVMFQNEGTMASPYWMPSNLDSPGMFGVFGDWRDGVGMPIADTSGGLKVPGSGVRIFGQGSADTDSGAVPQTAGEGGIKVRLTTTNEVAHLVALGMDAGVMQPDQHSMLVVEAIITHISAITDRAAFIGFIGLAADALDPPVTGATTVATLVQDDLAGLHFDSGYDDTDRLYGVHNKSNEAATQDLTVDGDTATDVPAAATSQRLRVEIDADGTMRCFADKVLIYTNAESLDVDEEVSPVLYLESNAVAIKSADVDWFASWAFRN